MPFGQYCSLHWLHIPNISMKELQQLDLAASQTLHLVGSHTGGAGVGTGAGVGVGQAPSTHLPHMPMLWMKSLQQWDLAVSHIPLHTEARHTGGVGAGTGVGGTGVGGTSVGEVVGAWVEHKCVLHVRSSLSGHSLPSLLASLSTVANLTWMPVPQVLVQPLHSCHANEQSTGHSCTLQLPVSTREGHGLPPYTLACVFLRVRMRTPVLQGSEHSDQSPHSATSQSTGIGVGAAVGTIVGVAVGAGVGDAVGVSVNSQGSVLQTRSSIFGQS